MAIPIFSYGNCEDNLIGSGQRDCIISDFGDLIGVNILKRVKWNVQTDSLNKESWIQNIKELVSFPYLSASDFIDNTEDNETSTSSTGIIETIRQGKPYFELQYRLGGCMHKSLYNKKGFGKWDAALIFDKGILLRITADGSEIRGFTIGDFSVETLRFNAGSDRQRTSTKFQLIHPDELNAYHVFFTWESLGFSALDIAGVVDTDLVVSDVLPSAETINVKVVASCNHDDVILGLDDADLWSLQGESAPTITGVTFNTSTNTYTLTLSGTIGSDEITLRLSQDGLNVVEDLDGGLYKGAVQFTPTLPSV